MIVCRRPDKGGSADGGLCPSEDLICGAEGQDRPGMMGDTASAEPRPQTCGQSWW